MIIMRWLIGLFIICLLFTATTCGKKGPPTVMKIDDCLMTNNWQYKKEKVMNLNITDIRNGKSEVSKIKL